MLFYGKTDVGRRRHENQDDFVIKTYPEGTVLAVVCDGMGGANGGKIASGIASCAFVSAVDEAQPDGGELFSMTGDEITALLESAVREANLAVYDRTGEDPSLTGMGTTLVGGVIRGCELYAVNVGDSRLYTVRADGGIEQLSHDHSYVQYLVDLGKMTEEEARTSSRKNIITRAVGTERNVEVDSFYAELCLGDSIVICSDGLSNLVEDSEIAEIVSSAAKDAELQSACEKLIALANERGGVDNITALVLSV